MTEVKRKLASIRRIKALVSIPGAERIEIALVDGWQTIVQKGQFKEGELAVFLEIDSFVPTSIAPFLTSAGKSPSIYNGVQGERLKTTKRMKQLSQGLLLSLEALGSGQNAYEEGDDVTEALGIQKWEAPEEKATNTGMMAAKTRSFPYFIRKTDQERAQNYGPMIAANLDTKMEVTVKKDGSSLTVFRVNPASQYYEDAKAMVHGTPTLWQKIKRFLSRKKDEPVYGLCSRNVLLPLEGQSNFHTAAAPLIAALKDYASIVCEGSIALQGELVAPDIQGNYEKVDGVEFHLFDIFSIDRQEYHRPWFVRSWAEVATVTHATVVDKGTLRDILQLQEGEDPVAKLLVYASGEGDNPGVMREGVVFKAEDKDFSFKTISNEYLLHKG